MELLGARPKERGDSGETLAFLVLWPAMLVTVLLMLVHAFIVTNARAEAELAASQGLRAAWRAAADADADFATDPGAPSSMAVAAGDAVARVAADEGGWRWWTPNSTEVFSDWCHPVSTPDSPTDRPPRGQTGWVRVVVSGEVFGPLAALWPNRWDRISTAAQGPAVLLPPEGDRYSGVPDSNLALC